MADKFSLLTHRQPVNQDDFIGRIYLPHRDGRGRTILYPPGRVDNAGLFIQHS
ncbi:hypothetical protein [Endozoicomonas sp. Mp262]|uniref:hypothetical protein n=1 Tax=Endozoicomonas sp. Mp262 TaxID=2919499 RepID=UPI0021D8FEF0